MVRLPRVPVQGGWSVLDVLLAIEALVVGLYSWVYFPISDRHRGDFLAMLSHRETSYSDWWDGEGIGYGPIFAIYDLVLRPLSDLAAMRLMYAVNLCLLVASVIVLIRTFLPPPRTRRELLVALFIATNFYPVFQLIRQNNVEITELAFLSFAYAALLRGRQISGGLFIGLAAATKLIPVCLFAVLIWRRRWHAFGAALVTLVGAFVVVGVLKDFGPMDLWRDVATQTTLPFPREYNNNQAISGFFHRLVAELRYTDPLLFNNPRVLYPQFAAWATKLASLVTLAIVAVIFIRRSGWWPRPSASAKVEVIEMQIVLLVSLLIIDHAHTHYFGLLLPLYFIALREGTSDGVPQDVPWIFLFSFLFLGFLAPLRVFDPLVMRLVPGSAIEVFKLLSLPFAGGVLALIGALRIHARYAGVAAVSVPIERQAIHPAPTSSGETLTGEAS